MSIILEHVSKSFGARVILDEPDVSSLSSFIGVDGSNATLNSGRMLVTLVPHDDRSRTATEIIDSLRTRLQSVPGKPRFFRKGKMNTSTRIHHGFQPVEGARCV